LKTAQDKIKKKIKNLNNNVDLREKVISELEDIEPFAPHGNHVLTEMQRAVMTEEVAKKFEDILDILKIDRNDPNVIDTPMRIASMYVNEWMIGRYSDHPRMESFPNDIVGGQFVVKKCKVQSLCSHHFAPFFTEGNSQDSYCMVVYRPTTNLMGISKISRLVDYYARRPQLQENLCAMVRNDLVKTLGSEDVMVYMKNLIHTCESTRGSDDVEATTTSLVFGGVFDDVTIRSQFI
jgi:GTP cyclohydrolase I